MKPHEDKEFIANLFWQQINDLTRRTKMNGIPSEVEDMNEYRVHEKLEKERQNRETRAYYDWIRKQEGSLFMKKLAKMMQNDIVKLNEEETEKRQEKADNDREAAKDVEAEKSVKKGVLEASERLPSGGRGKNLTIEMTKIGLTCVFSKDDCEKLGFGPERHTKEVRDFIFEKLGLSNGKKGGGLSVSIKRGMKT